MSFDNNNIHNQAKWIALERTLEMGSGWKRGAVAVACSLLLFVAGCTPVNKIVSDTITVEGRITYQGNTPFEALILETEGRNLYVLKMDPQRARALMRPMRAQVSGRLYLDSWNGTPFAHIEVSSLAGTDS